MKIFKIALVSILAAGTLFAGTYKVDVSHSNVGFKVKHMMITNVKGNFNEFEGVIEYDEQNKLIKDITGVIQVGSIDTDNDKRDKHLVAEDIFNAAKFPTIEFELVKIQSDKAYGNLTMHGVTKLIELEYENNGVITDPWGKQRVGIELEGEINRKDFGVNWNKILEAGGVAVSEEVQLEISLQGILQE
jgi:polyisoprenoid-binding protein YceI